MPKKIRIIVPHTPHHIIQRGCLRQQVFLTHQDFETYRCLLSYQCERHNVRISSYCLMPHHLHLTATPITALGLTKAIEHTHRQYAKHIKSDRETSEEIWHDTFLSYPMRSNHFLEIARYIERRPVAAGIVHTPLMYPWSSCMHNSKIRPDYVVTDQHWLDHFRGDWQHFVNQPSPKDIEAQIWFNITQGGSHPE